MSSRKKYDMSSVDKYLTQLKADKKMNPRKILCKGDKVRVTMPVHNLYCRGIIQKVDGFDIYVKLTYKGIVVHRLYNEVFHIVRGKQPIKVKMSKEQYTKY